jgi:hypothetical protein
MKVLISILNIFQSIIFNMEFALIGDTGILILNRRLLSELW